jgi:N-acetyl-gamma-glutamyl-phosphate reductase
MSEAQALKNRLEKGQEKGRRKGERKVAIVGARGYSGLDLARILLQHPSASLEACFATDTDFALSEHLPEEAARQVRVAPMSELEALSRELDTVFLATPAETSMELAPKILAAGANVIDLSGAFRLKGENLEDRLKLYQKWYAFQHSSAEWIERAHYGLVPWAKPTAGSSSQLISNPGCYATAVMMALVPLLQADLIDVETLVIDAKSGTSGAGRKPAEHLLFTEVEGECLPYRIGKHQHLPEVCEHTRAFSGREIDPLLTTHLLNVRRGIIAGIYAKLKKDVRLEHIAETYARSYESYPLVKVGAVQDFGKRIMHPLISLKRVVGSARTHIAYEVHGSKLYVFSSIDNLLKGAASQAVENLNLLWGLPAETALNSLEGVL